MVRDIECPSCVHEFRVDLGLGNFEVTCPGCSTTFDLEVVEETSVERAIAPGWRLPERKASIAGSQPGQYFVIVNEEQLGPLSITQLKHLWLNGRVNSETPLWQPGKSEWTRLSAIISDLEPATVISPNKAKSNPNIKKGPTDGEAFMLMTGILLFLAGCGGLYHFTILFETAVYASGSSGTYVSGFGTVGGYEGRYVQNIGLLNDRQNGIIVSGIATVVGMVMWCAAFLRRSR